MKSARRFCHLRNLQFFPQRVIGQEDPAIGRADGYPEPPHRITVIVAVSGGSDSTGLARLLTEESARLHWSLVIAHMHHGTRGAGSDADAAFAADLAARLGWPCVTGFWKPKRSRHFEADARAARYEFLLRVAQDHQAKAIAVGHTQNDQAETILHRLLRGTGLRGLSGMPRVRRLTPDIVLIRPLLKTSRDAIRDYLKSLGQDFCEDPSNTDPDQTRARLRHQLLPLLARDYNPQVVSALTSLGMQAHQSQTERERRARIVLQRLVRDGGFQVKSEHRISISNFQMSDMNLAILTDVMRRIWRKMGWPEREMSALRWRLLARLVLTPPVRCRALWADFRAWSDGSGQLHIERGGNAASVLPPVAPCRIDDGLIEDLHEESDPIVVFHGNHCLKIQVSHPIVFPVIVTKIADGRTERIDRDAVSTPIMIRDAERTDRFAPLGMRGRHMRLTEFLRQRRVSGDERLRTPVIADARGVIWVPGHRIADRVKITADTRRVLLLAWLDHPADATTVS